MKKSFDLAGHALVLLTLSLTVYGQLVLKWQLDRAGTPPMDTLEKLGFLMRQMMVPWTASAIGAVLAASLVWMLAMTRLALSYAYPFMSLAFVITTGFGVLCLNESLSAGKIGGTILVVAGLILVARGDGTPNNEVFPGHS